MTIERFTRAEFEAALPDHKDTGKPCWLYGGVQGGEHVYLIPVKDHVNVMIRSSVHENGVAAETGKDSIRAWLVDGHAKPLGSKIQSYVTRLPGWRQRLTKVLRELFGRGRTIRPCPTCDRPMGVFEVKKEGQNKGRLFMKCWDHGHFTWMEDDSKLDRPKDTVPALPIASEEDVREVIAACRTKKGRVESLKEVIKEKAEFQLYALVHVFNNQTADEQRSENTFHHNGIGFSGRDAEFMSSLAKQYLDRGNLSPKQRQYLPKLARYARQIADDLMAA